MSKHTFGKQSKYGQSNGSSVGEDLYAAAIANVPNNLQWNQTEPTILDHSPDEKSHVGNPWEFYPTPVPMVAGALRQALKDGAIPSAGSARSILDVCAGTGVWGRTAKLVYPRANLVGVDLEPKFEPYCTDFNEYRIGDYLNMDVPRSDIVLCNPPFSLHYDVMDKLQSEKHGSLVYFLSTSKIIGRKMFTRLWGKTPPSWMYVYAERIKWKGGQDMWGRMVGFWDGTETPDTVTRTRWLDCDSFVVVV